MWIQEGKKMLICDDLVKVYSSCVAVNHVNVRLESGKVYAMLGPNGSGKTTLMKMIMGLICPTQGTISINGVPMNERDKARITYMPTENYFYSYMTIKDIVKFYKDFYKDFDEKHFYDLLDKMGLSFTGKVKNMSTGMLAKLKVAVALARHSVITMLDEPLNGIDILAREVITRAIMDNVDEKRIFVISSHLVDELEPIVNGALFMKAGKMVLAGDANELRKANGKSLVDLYKEVYGWGIPYMEQNGQMAYGGTYMPNGQASYGGTYMPNGQMSYAPNGQMSYAPNGQAPYGGTYMPNGQAPYGGTYMPNGQAPYGGAYMPNGQAPYGGAYMPNGQMPYAQNGQVPYGGAYTPNGQAPYGGAYMPNGQAPYTSNESQLSDMPSMDKYSDPYGLGSFNKETASTVSQNDKGGMQ